MAEEIAAASFEPAGEGQFRIRVDFDPLRLGTGSRTLARLNFDTQPSGQSSIAPLRVEGVEATRAGGEAIDRGLALGGRVFMIEHESLLDTTVAQPGLVRLTVYGLPGHSYRVQSSSVPGPDASWQNETTVELTGTSAVVELPAVSGVGFFRLVGE